MRSALRSSASLSQLQFREIAKIRSLTLQGVEGGLNFGGREQDAHTTDLHAMGCIPIE